LARLLIGRFPSTHNLIWDWANHAQYLLAYGVGLLLGRSALAWQRLQQLRWLALVLAMLSTLALMAYFQQPEGWQPPDGLRWLQRGLWGALQWWAIVAACGFARQHLDFDHPWRRALVPAVFCVYILHQTVIVLLTQWLRPWQLWAPAEGPLLVALTFALCAVGYLLVRRVPLLNLALGVSPASSLSDQRLLHAR
jgi:surface polysaccharide O-acyltransferase-like enzyme